MKSPDAAAPGAVAGGSEESEVKNRQQAATKQPVVTSTGLQEQESAPAKAGGDKGQMAVTAELQESSSQQATSVRTAVEVKAKEQGEAPASRKRPAVRKQPLEQKTASSDEPSARVSTKRRPVKKAKKRAEKKPVSPIEVGEAKLKTAEDFPEREMNPLADDKSGAAVEKKGGRRGIRLKVRGSDGFE